MKAESNVLTTCLINIRGEYGSTETTRATGTATQTLVICCIGISSGIRYG